MNNTTFDILLLIARPAAGKSETIDHLKSTEISERIQRYHIGQFVELDDFPMVWTWFEEDAILSRLGYPRLHTDDDNYFIGQHLWNLLIERINLEYEKLISDQVDFHKRSTVIIEFARGSEHGGYANAFKYLDRNIIQKMAVMFINVSWDESLRKNRARFNPDRPFSILEHGLTDEKLEKLYRFIDWEEVSAQDPHFLTIQGVQVPYIVFENEDDVTTARGELLSARLENVLGRLWTLYSPNRYKVEND
jgi:hypothetical protein